METPESKHDDVAVKKLADHLWDGQWRWTRESLEEMIHSCPGVRVIADVPLPMDEFVERFLAWPLPKSAAPKADVPGWTPEELASRLVSNFTILHKGDICPIHQLADFIRQQGPPAVPSDSGNLAELRKWIVACSPVLTSSLFTAEGMLAKIDKLAAGETLTPCDHQWKQEYFGAAKSHEQCMKCGEVRPAAPDPQPDKLQQAPSWPDQFDAMKAHAEAAEANVAKLQTALSDAYTSLAEREAETAKLDTIRQQDADALRKLTVERNELLAKVAKLESPPISRNWAEGTVPWVNFAAMRMERDRLRDQLKAASVASTASQNVEQQRFIKRTLAAYDENAKYMAAIEASNERLATAAEKIAEAMRPRDLELEPNNAKPSSPWPVVVPAGKIRTPGGYIVEWDGKGTVRWNKQPGCNAGSLAHSPETVQNLLNNGTWVRVDEPKDGAS